MFAKGVPIDKFKNVFHIFEFSFKTTLTLGLGIENVIMGLLQVGDIEFDRHKPLITNVLFLHLLHQF